MSKNDSVDCWPTGLQTELLRASLVPGPAAIQAWSRWKSQVDLTGLDIGSSRLLGLAYHNLVHQGFTPEQIPECAQSHRINWLRNQILLYQAGQLIKAFKEIGLPTMLLKGAALLNRYYPDCGARYMEDIDLLIPFDRRFEAVDHLRMLGWRNWTSDETLADSLASGHSNEFVNDREHKIDLHWRVFHAVLEVENDDDFWRKARPCELAEVPTAIPHPTELLLHVLAHGAQWTRWQFAQWPADAWWILASEPAFDWDSFLARSLKSQLTLPVRDCLKYLATELDAPIPPRVLSELDQARVPRSRQVLHSKCTLGRGLRYDFDLAGSVGRLVRLLLDRKNASSSGGLIAQLKKRWKVDHAARLPLAAAKLLFRKTSAWIRWKFGLYKTPQWQSKNRGPIDSQKISNSEAPRKTA